MSQYNEFERTNEASPQDVAPIRAPWTKWLTLIVSLVLLCVVGIGGYLALTWPSVEQLIERSVEAHRNGKSKLALRLINRAIKRDKTLESTFRRAQLLQELKKYQESMQDAKLCRSKNYELDACEEIIIFNHYFLRELDQAIEMRESILSKKRWQNGKIGEVETCNGLAWFYAMANRELPRALQLANRALRVAAADKSPEYRLRYLQTLDTRAYVYYQQGKYELALKDINEAIGGVHRASEGQTPAEQRFTVREKTKAAMYYHRAIIYDKLKRPGNSKPDFDKVRGMGFEPTAEALHF